MPIIRRLNSKAIILGPSDSESVGSAHVIRYNGTPLTQRTYLNFSGPGVLVQDDAGNDETDIIISSGGGGGGSTVENLVLGETIAIGPVAVYPKLTKTIVIDGTNNKLSFYEGAGSPVTATIASGTYFYPYTELATEIKTQMESLGASTYTVTLDQTNTKIEAEGGFSIDQSVANSITGALGYSALDTETNSVFYRADSLQQYTHTIALFRTNTTDDSNPPYIDNGLFNTLVDADHRSRSFSGFILTGGAKGSTASLYLAGEITGFSGLTMGSKYYINGTSGEISTSQVANSLVAGYAKDATTLVMDPGPKDFEFQVEPDTDVVPNSIDDLPAWLSEPELISASAAHSVYESIGAAGNYRFLVKNDSGTTSGIKVSWSVDKGQAYKEYGTFFASGESWGHPTANGPYYAKPVIEVIENNDALDTAQKVTNGAFDSDLSGWTTGTGNVWSSGVLAQTYSGGSGASATQSISGLTPGKMYELRVDSRVASGPGNSIITVRDANGSGYVYGSDTNNSSTYKTSVIRFMARTSVAHITLYNAGDPVTIHYDNVSILEVETKVNVFIAYTYYDGTYYEVRGLYGVVDSNGDLTLAQTNDGVGGINEDSISSTDATASIVPISVKFKNGYLYVLSIHSGRFMYVHTSSNFGQTFNAVNPMANGGGSAAKPLVIGIADFAPIHLVVTEDPASPGNNRVGIVYSADNTNGDPFLSSDYNLQYIYQDANVPVANGYSGLTLGDATALGIWNIATGICWANDEETKIAINVVPGHGAGIAAGSTAPNGGSNKVYVKILDVGTVTPTFFNSKVSLYASSDPTLGTTAFFNGYSAQNTNGYYFVKNPNTIAWLGGNAFVVATHDTWQNNSFVLHYTPDVVGQPNVSYPITNPYRNLYGVDSIYNDYLKSECQFVKQGSQLFAITKSADGSMANNLSQGRIFSGELVYNNSVKPEVITNGTFDTDVAGWTNLGGGSTTWVSGKLRLTNGGSQTAAYQAITTEPGKTYVLSVDVDLITGPNFILKVYSYFTSDTNAARGDLLTTPAISTDATGFKLSFVAKSTSSWVYLIHGGGGVGSTIDFDNVSVKLADVQPLPEVDIGGKPSVDDEGFAGKIQTISLPSAACVLFKKNWKFNEIAEGTYYEQPSYQEFSLKTEDVAYLWDRSPAEVFDTGHTSNIEQWDVSASPNGQYRMALAYQTANQNGIFQFSDDYGKTWKIPSLPVLNLPLGYTANDGDYVDYSPQIWLDNDGRVFIARPFYDGANTRIRGLYGVVSGGELSLSQTNTTGDILNTSQGQFEIRLREFNGKIYVSAREGTNGQINIAVSSNYGQTFTNGGAGGAGTYGSMKTVASVITTAVTNQNYGLFIVPDPDVPANNRVVMISNSTATSAGLYGLGMYWTDNQDLSANWETALAIRNSGLASTDALMGTGMSDGYKLAMLIYNGGDGAGRIRMAAWDLATSTPTQISPANTMVNGAAFGLNNGSYSSEVFHISERKIKWTTENSLVFTMEEQNASGFTHTRGRLIKVYDVANSASSITSTTGMYWLEGSQFVRATESQLVVSGGVNWLVFRTVNNAESAANPGRIRATRWVDTSPTSNTEVQVWPATAIEENSGNLGIQLFSDEGNWAELSNKVSHSVMTSRLRVKQLDNQAIACFESVNSDGYNAVYVNSNNEKVINPLTVEWAKLPVQISSYATDTLSHNFYRRGKFVIATSAINNAGQMYAYVSSDGGKSWLFLTNITYNFSGLNNTNDWLYYHPLPFISPDQTKFLIFWQYQTGNYYYRKIYGTITDGRFVIVNENELALDSLTGASTIYKGKVEHRGNRTYVFGNQAGSRITYVNSSTSFFDTGVTSATQVSVKDGVSAFTKNSNSSYLVHISDNGSGGNRINHFARRETGSQYPTHCYSNDEGVTWATAINIATVSNLNAIGIGSRGNKVALLLATSSAVYVAVCNDISAATPTWSSQQITGANLTGHGEAGTGDGTYVADMGHQQRSTQRIHWTTDDSFIVIFDGRHNAGFDVTAYVKVPDSTSLATYQFGFIEAASSVHKLESQIAVSDNGRMFAVYKITSTSSFANNLTGGRYVSRELYDSTPTANTAIDWDDNVIDLAFKPSASSGGQCGRGVVLGDTVIFEKENGSGHEQMFIQSLTAKANGRI